MTHYILVVQEPGDMLALCSDGIHDEIGEGRLWELFGPALGVTA